MDTTQPHLPYSCQNIDKADIEAVAEAMASPRLTTGPQVSKFESALSAFTGSKYAVAVSSGTAALHLACLAANIRPGHYGVTSPITFVASANAVRYCGAMPLFSDISPSTALLSPECLAKTLAHCEKSKTLPRVIIPVSFAGQTPDLPQIRALADQYGAMVIEDAAHSLGATYQFSDKIYKSASCSHTDMATLSFHPVKHIATGEGGAVTTNDPTLYNRLLMLRNHGITRQEDQFLNTELAFSHSSTPDPWYYEQQMLGFNYRITDIQCALGLSQLKKLDAFLARRRELALEYDTAFRTEPFNSFFSPLNQSPGSAYHLYVICLKSPNSRPEHVAIKRRRFYEILQTHNIGCQVHYIPVHLQPDFQKSAKTQKGDLPFAENYYRQCLSLPLYPGMSETDLQRVINACAKAIYLIKNHL